MQAVAMRDGYTIQEIQDLAGAWPDAAVTVDWTGSYSSTAGGRPAPMVQFSVQSDNAAPLVEIHPVAHVREALALALERLHGPELEDSQRQLLERIRHCEIAVNH